MRNAGFIFSLVLGLCLPLQAQFDIDATASLEATSKTLPEPQFRPASYTPATYVGGVEALHAYLAESFDYTPDERVQGLEGSIIVGCMIGPSGKPTKAWIVQSLNPAVDERAMKVVLDMPAWKPALLNGKATNMKVNIPFKMWLR